MFKLLFRRNSMWRAIENAFLRTAGIVLGITSATKLTSLLRGTTILERIDPVLGVSNWSLLAVLAAIEGVIAAYLLFSSSPNRVPVLAWLSTLFALYHLASARLGFAGCPCLGTNLGFVSLTAVGSTTLAKSITACLIAGSYIFLLKYAIRTKSSGQDNS